MPSAATDSLSNLADGLLARITPSASAVPEVSAASCQLSLITTREGFDALEAEWSALFERAARPEHVFQTYNWNWHWANHYLTAGRGMQLAIVVGRRQGRAVMIWPMVTERFAGLTQVSWMGAPASQYGDVLVEPGENVLDLLREGYRHLLAQSKPDIVALAKVRADANVAPLMAELGAVATQTLAAAYLNFATAPDLATYEQRYTTKAKRNRRRQYRRLEERGAVEARWTSHGSTETGTRAVAAIDMKRAWLKERGTLSQALGDDRLSRFFAEAASSTDHPVQIQVGTLACGTEIAASEVSIVCKGHVFGHILTYASAFEKAGPGALLVERSLKHCYDAGYERLDLLAPADAYKLEWADATIPVIDWALPLTISGRVYAKGYLALRPKLKVLAHKLPLSLRRRIA